MIIKNKKNINIKKIVILAAAVLALMAISVAALEKLHIINLINSPASQQSTSEKRNSTKIDNNPATQEQINNGNATKTGLNSDTPPVPTVTKGSDKKTVQLTISSANQNGSILQIRVLIGVVENTGTCTLTLTNTGRPTVTKTAGTQALASSSTCKGFDVPMSELSTGAWQALITYDSSTLTGSATKAITLQ